MLAVAGCGSSSSKVSAGSYVGSVCSATANWYRTIQVAGRKLEATVRTSQSISKVKSAYVAFVDSLLHATHRAQQQLKDAGIPSVDGGKRISNQVMDAFDRAGRSADEVALHALGRSVAHDGPVGGRVDERVLRPHAGMM